MSEPERRRLEDHSGRKVVELLDRNREQHIQRLIADLERED